MLMPLKAVIEDGYVGRFLGGGGAGHPCAAWFRCMGVGRVRFLAVFQAREIRRLNVHCYLHGDVIMEVSFMENLSEFVWHHLYS
jgi:hypothetical protein